jgi:hypothetical protein
MKIYQAVKTKEQAKQVITDAFKSEEKNFEDGIWSNASCQCDCGETSLLKYNANSVNSDGMVQYAVGICSSCGTDSPSTSAVLNINIW